MRIGSRSSAMALAQTTDVAAKLSAADKALRPEIVKFTPQGDRDQLSRLDTHGGKGGAFVEEIRAAMLLGDLNAAMHSLKDMPGNEETPGLVVAAMLARETSQDVLVLKSGLSRDEFLERKGAGFKIGTNAVRRAAYVRRLYPQAEIIHYRGAIDTRFRKLDAGEKQKMPDGSEVGPADALILAKAGLLRLSFEARISYEFSIDEILPAVGQGIVAVECPADDWVTRRSLALIDDLKARQCADAEREVLWLLNGHCNSPIAGHASIEGDQMRLRASVISLDGASLIESDHKGPANLPRELGRAVGLDLINQGAMALIEASQI